MLKYLNVTKEIIASSRLSDYGEYSPRLRLRIPTSNPFTFGE